MRVGPDGKVYLIVGDTGRRGQMQNLIDGPFVYPFPPTNDGSIGDDQFGGPDPDFEHLTGVILRLNTDGSAPKDNPFYDEGADRGGQVGASLKKLYAYGIRNSFGMAFDPFSGDLWEQENGDDSFSEINRVKPGFNSGWVQVMGPLSRVAQFREIETNARPDRRSRGRQLLRPAADSLGPAEHRHDAARGRQAPVPAPRLALQRPRAGLEVRVRPGRHRLPLPARARQEVPRRPVRRLRERPREQHLPAADRPQPKEDRSERQAPARSRRRQHPQVRPDRERVAAVRHGLRRHARRAREPRRHALRRLDLAGNDLRDPQAVAPKRAVGGRVSRRPRTELRGDDAPARNRTWNLRIKSPLLCQLSYKGGSSGSRIAWERYSPGAAVGLG